MSAYTDRVEHGLGGLKHASTGPCPGCEECAGLFGFDSVKAFDAAHDAGKVSGEAGFSWSPCGICGSRLGGNREVWHAIDENGEILHSDDACTDCVVFLAYGDEPDDAIGEE